MRICRQITDGIDQLRPADIVVNKDVTLGALNQRQHIEFVRQVPPLARTTFTLVLLSYRRSRDATCWRIARDHTEMFRQHRYVGSNLPKFHGGGKKSEKLLHVTHADLLPTQVG